MGGISDEYAGRVEVFHSGVWQSVCDDSWDINEADVVCRELGYGTATEATTGSHFGEGGTGQWKRSWACNGDETCLESCAMASFPVSDSSRCSSGRNAGVVCSLSSKRYSTTVHVLVIAYSHTYKLFHGNDCSHFSMWYVPNTTNN